VEGRETDRGLKEGPLMPAKYAGTTRIVDPIPFEVVVHEDPRETQTKPYMQDGRLHVFRRTKEGMSSFIVHGSICDGIILVHVTYPSITQFIGGGDYHLVKAPDGQWCFVKVTDKRVKAYRKAQAKASSAEHEAEGAKRREQGVAERAAVVRELRFGWEAE
jgi:hypothetical protein